MIGDALPFPRGVRNGKVSPGPPSQGSSPPQPIVLLGPARPPCLLRRSPEPVEGRRLEVGSERACSGCFCGAFRLCVTPSASARALLAPAHARGNLGRGLRIP